MGTLWFSLCEFVLSPQQTSLSQIDDFIQQSSLILLGRSIYTKSLYSQLFMTHTPLAVSRKHFFRIFSQIQKKYFMHNDFCRRFKSFIADWDSTNRERVKQHRSCIRKWSCCLIGLTINNSSLSGWSTKMSRDDGSNIIMKNIL